MDRNRALEELMLRIENQNLLKHSFAVEAIMRKCASHFHDDPDLWGIAGLVHDIDLERVNYDMSVHGMMGGDILEAQDFDKTIVYAVRAHNPNNQYERRRKIDKALYCAEALSELITACALAAPGKKLGNVDVPFVLEKFENRSFAKEVNREQIASCLELGLSLEQMVALSLEAMKEISDVLEL